MSVQNNTNICGELSSNINKKKKKSEKKEDNGLNNNGSLINSSKINFKDSTSIDLLLNNILNSIDNKNFKNMYYISYKIIFGFIEELKNNNVQISDKVVENFINKDFNDIMNKFTNNLKKRNRKTLQNDLRCMGRKIDGKQCTRRKKNGNEYCQSHLKKLTNGRIDEDYTQPKKKNKRGRKRKVEFDPRAYDDEYITTWEDIVDDEKVLVDVNNNVYSFDLTNPKLLGKKSLDGKLIKL